MPFRRHCAGAWALSTVVGCAAADGSGNGGFETIAGPGEVPSGSTSAGAETTAGNDDWTNVDSTGGSEGESTSGGAPGDGTTAAMGDTAAGITEDSGSMSTGVAANPFEGDYAGTASGECNVVGSVMGDWTITVDAEGNFVGNVSVSGVGDVGFDGTVSEEGEVVTTAGACGFIGTVDTQGGSGDFDCDAGCSGTWTGSAV
ncbi:MAG: hypothetical protein AAF721_03280 [Myxococcota bacterium]